MRLDGWNCTAEFRPRQSLGRLVACSIDNRWTYVAEGEWCVGSVCFAGYIEQIRSSYLGSSKVRMVPVFEGKCAVMQLFAHVTAGETISTRGSSRDVLRELIYIKTISLLNV